MVFNRDQIQYLIQNEILPNMTWEFPSRGMFDAGNPPTIQGQIDQLLQRIPFRPLSSANMQVPRILNSSADFFIDGLTSNYELQESDLSIAKSSPTPPSYQMEGIAAKLEIPSSALGSDAREQNLHEFMQVFGQTLQRFLSVATIYGKYDNDGWQYYETSTYSGWNQSSAFLGLQEMCGTPLLAPGTWGDNGYSLLLQNYLTLSEIDNFLTLFKGPNNGKIDYLVMNSTLRNIYLSLWRSINQLPQYINDPLTGELCLAHDGIPIIVNDYIINFDPGAGADFVYLTRLENPEYFEGGNKQTSMYAVVLGEEKGGLFGVYPESFGSSPLKLEHSVPSQTQDTILLKGMIEAGIVPKTRMSVGRLAGIFATT
jgi:hypothetical protein